MTHLTMRGWARLVGADPALLPPYRSCCTGGLLPPKQMIGALHYAAELPTCPECAVYADAAREMNGGTR